MRHLLQLAAAVFLTTTTTTHAQITNPDTLVAPPPRNPALARPNPTADLQWLWQYARPSNKAGLLADTRFKALLDDNLKAPQAMWGTGSTLSEAATAFLAGEGVIASTDNRHLTITGCAHLEDTGLCAQRGLLWIDLGPRNPLIVFLALRWNEQGRTTDQPAAPFTLWIFPSRPLEPHELPQPLKDAISTFASDGSCSAPRITSTIVVDPSGVPHVVGTLESGVPPAVCTHA